jgi:hypothetical protein
MSLPLFQILLVLSWLYAYVSGSGIVPRANFKWLKPTSKLSSVKRSFDSCLKIRGGADASTGKDGKVRGTCIGIDLGTTYR